MEKLFRYFKLKENGTTAGTEIIAGITTFLSMAYILTINPTLLAGTGMSYTSVLTATAIAAAVGCAFMAFFANYPIALASGSALNSYFAYSICRPMVSAGIENPWQIALTAVFVEGIIFLIISLFCFKKPLTDKIPSNLKHGITAGLGLFIALTGLKKASIILPNASSISILGSILNPYLILGAIGLLIIALLYRFKVPGYMLIGIAATWVIGMIAQAIGLYRVDFEHGIYNLFPQFSSSSLLPAAPSAFKFNFGYAASHILEFAVIVFSLLFIDLFGTVGTIAGISDSTGISEENGAVPKSRAAMMAGAASNIIGACLGTSTVTSCPESVTGAAQGGRTGLTSLTTGVLFLLALVLSPLFTAVPSFAVTPALVFTGFLMMSSVKKMSFDGDIADTFGGFIAIVMIPFTFSIANGVMAGVLAWVVLKIFTGKIKDIPLIMWLAAAVLIIRIIMRLLSV